jgi:hypothetical protein
MGYKYVRNENGERVKVPLSEEEEKRNAEMFAPMIAAHEDAKKRGLGRDKGGSGDVVCPRCKRGRVNYSVSATNGHIWGACSTAGCASWME